MALTNPDAEDKSKITGYLTISINLSGPGDNAAELKLGSDEEVAKKEPWKTPNIKTTFKQFYFKFIKGVGLPRTDTIMGTIDAYIYYEKSSKIKLKTKVSKGVDVDGNLVSEWNQEMLIPVELPNSNDDITFMLYDYNVTKDEFVGNIHFSIKELEERLDKEKYILQWCFLYGCHQENTGKIADLQNSDPSLAVTFKGRVLVEVRSKVVDQPLFKIQDVHKHDKHFYERLQHSIKKHYDEDHAGVIESEASEEEMDMNQSQMGSHVKTDMKKELKKKKSPDAIDLDESIDVFDALKKFIDCKTKI